ncbi:DNA cytosine methyltransferase [Streptomyces canus]|uniref:DNA cytosine methyltransferase n=1 Tax=Streptomyces canus TaxID=58343 RepID=UPI003248EDEB
MSLTFTDIFCGAGGSSTGLVAAGLELKLAANHWARAIETHAANHTAADHLCADINNYDMRRLPKTDILWASPICTEMSPAGGRRRTRGQMALELEEFGSVPAAAWERTRATAYDVIRATEVHRYKAILCENVVEFAVDWELFDWWRKGMEMLGYNSQVVSASSAHIGGQGNDPAPQWRDRIYIVFTQKGIPLPDVKPAPPAWCQACDEQVNAVQTWRNGRRIGKYKQQYDYRCPNSRCRHALVEPHIRPAAAIIDWSNLGVRIGDRAENGLRPLVANTVKRIESGLKALGDAKPMVLTVNHGGHDGRAFPADGRPLAVRTVKIGDAVLTPPAARDAFVVEYRRNGGAEPATRPLATVTAKGNHHGLVMPYVSKSGEQAGTVPSLDDCHYRMIQPREQLYAQRFPTDYVVLGGRAEQTMQAGNAVSCNVAQWVGERVAAALDKTAGVAA